MKLKHNGDITNRAIAKKLGANEKTVSVWKYRYKWKEELERSTKSKNKSTTKNLSVGEKQRKRIVDALNVANSYSPALNILIDVYLDCFEEYENAKAGNMETESLRKELARLLRDLGLDISNRKITMRKSDKKKEEKKTSTNKLVQFRQRMTGGGSNDKFLEKNMVLDISFEQKKHFERNGIKVVMTRTTDEYLDSIPRTNRVKNSCAKYCISNHINAAGGKGEGAETIHSIYANKKIAQGILDALVRLGAKYRRVFSRQGSNGDWYYMLRMTGSIQTTIIEYGFADNASDTKKIIKDWKKYAEAVARYYIEQVFGQKYVAPGKSTSKPSKPATKPQSSGSYTVKSGDTLSAIAKTHNTTVAKLQKDNNIKNADVIHTGQKLQLGGSKAPVTSKPKANLIVDGKWAEQTTRALQIALNTVVDGNLSGQLRNAVTSAMYDNTVQFGSGGSMVIRALQRLIGSKVDGLLGPQTIWDLQVYLGTVKDGKLSRPSLVVKELQRRLNAGTFV